MMSDTPDKTEMMSNTPDNRESKFRQKMHVHVAKEDWVFKLVQMMFCIMTLHNFLSFVKTKHNSRWSNKLVLETSLWYLKSFTCEVFATTVYLFTIDNKTQSAQHIFHLIFKHLNCETKTMPNSKLIKMRATDGSESHHSTSLNENCSCSWFAPALLCQYWLLAGESWKPSKR